jgi:hypothetical protein
VLRARPIVAYDTMYATTIGTVIEARTLGLDVQVHRERRPHRSARESDVLEIAKQGQNRPDPLIRARIGEEVEVGVGVFAGIALNDGRCWSIPAPRHMGVHAQRNPEKKPVLRGLDFRLSSGHRGEALDVAASHCLPSQMHVRAVDIVGLPWVEHVVEQLSTSASDVEERLA